MNTTANICIYQNRHNCGNNGDYVQSWASLQYYPCVDRSFERDNLKNLPHLRFYARSNWNEIDNEKK